MLNRSYIIGHEGHPHYLSDLKFINLRKSIKLTSKEKDFIEIINNLSDPTKLKIYSLIKRVQEIAVTDIAQVLGLSQSTVSHALSDLKNLGIVQCHRCGQLICYSLSSRKNFAFSRILKGLMKDEISKIL